MRFTAKDIEEPFGARDPLYRTGLSVGDYPIDHHHKRNPAAPQHLWFVPAPSFSVPLGALVPEVVDGLVVADKAISVSNVANGTTRLQPVVLLTGQGAGALAALAARQGREPRAVPVRDVQRALLDAGAFILPYIDVPPDHPRFACVQRVGATGILKGRGVPHQWANQTWFYPDFPIDALTLQKGLLEFEPVAVSPADGRPLEVGEAVAMVSEYRAALLAKDKVRFARLELRPVPGARSLGRARARDVGAPAARHARRGGRPRRRDPRPVQPEGRRPPRPLRALTATDTTGGEPGGPPPEAPARPRPRAAGGGLEVELQRELDHARRARVPVIRPNVFGIVDVARRRRRSRVVERVERLGPELEVTLLRPPSNRLESTRSRFV